jgi:membrane protease YdiL (CAAX protease family)
MALEIDNKPFLQLILILSLCLISVTLFSVLGGLIAFFSYGIESFNINDLGNPNTIKRLKVIQLFTAGGLFIAAPIAYAFVSSGNISKRLSLKNSSKPINYLLVLIMMIISAPFVSWVIEMNANIILPEFMSGLEQWFRIKQDEAFATQKAFLTFDGVGGLIYVVIIFVIIPALGEELLFRGVLQKIFINWTKNPHVGIWIAAFFFGLLHMQFYSFIPIMLLGAMFGYIFYWSNSLWLPIMGHFINNGSVVIASYFYPDSMKNDDISIFGDSQSSAVFYVASFIISVAIFYLIWKVNQKETRNNQNNNPITV